MKRSNKAAPQAGKAPAAKAAKAPRAAERKSQDPPRCGNCFWGTDKKTCCYWGEPLQAKCLYCPHYHRVGREWPDSKPMGRAKR